MADVQIRDNGSITLFTPLSANGKEWTEENLSLEPWQWTGDTFAVEAGYASAVIDAMKNDGLALDEGHKTAAVPLPSKAPAAPAAQPPVGESVAVGEEQPQHERKTVVPELPNALFHMAAVDEGKMEALREQALEATSHRQHEMGPWEALNDHLEEAICRGCKAYVHINTNPAPNDIDIGGDALAINCKNPLRTFEDDEVPEFSEADRISLRGMGVRAKLAGRGGWHRVSMFTIQSDDKRFTITEIDPTRRKNWFLLKDLETGLAYEETTMTGAKSKAKMIRDKTPLEDDTTVEGSGDDESDEPVQEVAEAIAEVVPSLDDTVDAIEELTEKRASLQFKNPLLASRSHEKFVDRRMNNECLGCGNNPCTCKTKGKLRNRKRHGKNELMSPSSGGLDNDVKLRKSEQERRKN